MPRPTPFPPTRALLVTSGLAMAWVPPLALGQTVTEAIPIDSEFGALGTGWVTRFGHNLGIPDIDGDGAVTNADFTSWLGFRLRDIPLIGPVDQFGELGQENVPPCQQAAMALADHLRLLAGDVTLDGVVDQADVQKITQALQDLQQGLESPNSPAFVQAHDVNQDDVISDADVIAVINALGSIVGEAAIAAAQSAVATTPECGGGGPVPLPPWEGNFRHPKHNPWISSGYPAHVPQTSQVIEPWTVRPGRFPNDHSSQFSATWPMEPKTRPFPNHGQHFSNVFPPNHVFHFSGTWPDDPVVHRVEVSREWPPNHAAENSATWYPNPHTVPPGTPTHLCENSRGWDSNHQASFSFMPQDHDGTITKLPNRSPHNEHFSSGWQHGADDSKAKWPPNHDASNSSSWQPGGSHRFDVTVIWPAGHQGQVSSGWPQDGKQRDWPATHFKTYSDQIDRDREGVPRDVLPPGLIPAGHDWLTSIHQFIPFVPTPTSPPPPGQ